MGKKKVEHTHKYLVYVLERLARETVAVSPPGGHLAF
jgi:hypothetical protein